MLQDHHSAAKADAKAQDIAIENGFVSPPNWNHELFVEFDRNFNNHLPSADEGHLSDHCDADGSGDCDDACEI